MSDLDQSIEPVLDRFQSVSLADLETAALQDRIDTKYVLTIDKFISLMDELKDDYLILEINKLRSHQYHTLYYDTPDLDFYYQHFRGMLNRYKIRQRTYADSGISYFEVKFKSNKGRTVKTRVLLNSEGEINSEALSLLNGQTPYHMDELQKKFFVNFNRITLVSKNFKERLTFDTGLTYISDEETLQNNKIVIAELKQGKNEFSVFRNLMKKNHIRKSSLSKYCFGVVKLIKGVKKNNFKPLILSLNKKMYDIPTGY